MPCSRYVETDKCFHLRGDPLFRAAVSHPPPPSKNTTMLLDKQPFFESTLILCTQKKKVAEILGQGVGQRLDWGCHKEF